MLSRALYLATAIVIVSCGLVTDLRAQNLDAGKSPAQIFSSTCVACHRSPRGLLRTVAPYSLPGFLREHYTTGREMAGVLSGYLIANGAAAGPPAGTKQGARQDLRAGAPIGSAPAGAEPVDPRRPRPPAADADGLGTRPPAAQRTRPPRTDPAQTGVAGQPGVEGAPPLGPKGLAKQKLSKRGKKDEPPAVAATPEPPKPTAEEQARAADQAIEAAVPRPEPVELPPPSVADFKPDPPPVVREAAPALTLAPAEPAAARVESAPPPVPSGPPSPPISQ